MRFVVQLPLALRGILSLRRRTVLSMSMCGPEWYSLLHKGSSSNSLRYVGDHETLQPVAPFFFLFVCHFSHLVTHPALQ